ncbi:hypothetical protein K7957_12560 [Sphingomonas yunnanensis]|uniref:hypothetical protein n=1 Tax=Sphingomonas yunnanensis TaxID=310400 RepID=UPI001CA68E84|nr:hypothetical protein [Sphingomonas yunnanensis]MBY9063766.1 hypothetical protein [Sphingomonas yunnanensis]
MCEGFMLCALAFVLLAAASHRFHREAGATLHAQRRWLRGLGTALIVVALLRAGTAIDGERWVRLLVCASLAAVTVVLTLSVRAPAVLYPLRRLLTRRAETAARTREVEVLAGVRG